MSSHLDRLMLVRSLRVKSSRFTVSVLALTAALLLPAVKPSQAYEESRSAADSLRDRITELRHDASYGLALEVGRNLFQLLEGDQGVKTWELSDAERLVATLEVVSDLPAGEQQELAQADRFAGDMRLCKARGEYDVGAELARQQLEIRRRILGEDHPDVAQTLSDLAVFYEEQGKYAESETLCKQALAIREKVLGQGHPKVAESLNNLAILCYDQARYPESETLCQRAIAIKEEAYGPDDPRVASSLSSLGRLYMRQARYTESETLYRRALRIRLMAYGPDDRRVGSCLNNLGIVYDLQGRYADAEPLYKRALAIREKTHGPEHTRVAATLNNLGILYKNQGKYADAEPAYMRALPIIEKNLGPKHPSVAILLHNLAVLYCDGMHRYADAEQILERALEIREKALGPDHPKVAETLNSLGIVHKEQGEHAEAEDWFRRALAIRLNVFGSYHPEIPQVLGNLGALSEVQGKYREAEEYYREALAISEKIFGRGHPGRVSDLNNLAGCLLHQGNLADAEPVLEEVTQAFEIARLRVGTGLTRATFRSSPHVALAATKLELGRTDEAWPSAEKALARALADLLIASGQRSLNPMEIAREDSLKKSLSKLESQLAVLQKAAHDDAAPQTTEHFEETRRRLLSAEAEWSAFQHEIGLKYPVTEGETLPLELVRSSLNAETALVGWLWAEISLDELVCWGYVIRASGAVNWIRLGAFPKHVLNESPAETAHGFRDALRFAASWEERVTDVDEVASRGLEMWETWMAPLEPYLVGVENLVIIPSGPLIGIPVEAFVDSAGSYLGDRYAVSYAPSATIHAWLQGRAQERHAAITRKALLLGDPPFAPDHLIAAVQPEKAGSDMTIVEAFSDPAVLRSALVGTEEVLARLPRIPWTRREVETVASVIPGATTLLSRQASEQELVRLADSGDLHDFDIIHLATHALVDDERPERSALALARLDLPDPLKAAMAGTRIYDGLLTAKEIGREWKLDAELVTLSGCQTGLGKAVPGEGYIGLSYALLQAGARSVVVSLWRVEDEATALLMGRFYENLTGARRNGAQGQQRQPMSKAWALKEAKRWLRTYRDTEGRQAFRHPVYWSGFILIGDPM